ncbi:hypothetical protein MSG28_015458 [Choristoneura fumiferana]|uniref:Uncharacterized protein n=1 Tax=Choristoneura fumiferana TaxID=7141 RepID=A0ACC0KAU5_CHOFU|nr:hypothetical protein MSG28_015458 [Choristoneura fumiferana]
MYEEILKFGAEIVRALRRATAPVLVYIPPGAELRGGAWAVVDPNVNSARMEMYADPEASKNFDRRGSIDDVLVKTETGREAEGRAREMEAELLQCEKSAKAREKELQPIYHEDIIPWRDSRRVLYWRLRRLLLQNEQERRIQSAVQTADSMDHGAASATLRRWFTEDRGETQACDDNSVLERNLRAIKQDAVMQAVNGLVMDLTPSQRAEFIRKLTALEMEQ